MWDRGAGVHFGQPGKGTENSRVASLGVPQTKVAACTPHGSGQDLVHSHPNGTLLHLPKLHENLWLASRSDARSQSNDVAGL